MKKIISGILALSMSLVLLSGCSDNSNTSSDTTAATKATEKEKEETAAESKTEETTGDETQAEETADVASSSDVPAFEDIVFPDELPKQILMAEDGLYGYDDLTEPYSIEILTDSYGESGLPAEDDPVNQWLSKRFNLDITLTAQAGEDKATVISTRFAAGDTPDVFSLSSRDLGFTLSDQGLLLDAKLIYPYLPHSNNYTTKNMVKWSENKTNGEIPFITKYGIQDGVWGYAIRQDWLDTFGMDYPTTREELIEYAKACTFDDPDGNGKDDTYFMTGAGDGKGWGMLRGYETMFGNPVPHVDGGELSHQYFNGVRQDFLEFLNELYTLNVLAPDWYTMTWDMGRAVMSNDQLGMTWWPVGALFTQFARQDKAADPDALDIWNYWAEPPIEGGRYEATGNPGYMWAFSYDKFTDGGEVNEGKVKRVAHMIDTMTIGGENFFPTIQGSCDEVFEEAGLTLEGSRISEYTDNGTFFISNPEVYPYDNSDSWQVSLWIWQQFGLCVGYQVDYENPDDPYETKFAEKTNSFYSVIAQDYPRWPNDNLLVTLTGDAAEAQSTNTDWILAQEYAFVTGAKSFDEWDSFTSEWLGKGGKEIVQQAADQLGVPVPDYAQ